MLTLALPLLGLGFGLVLALQPTRDAEKPAPEQQKPGAYTLHPEHAYAPPTPESPAFKVVTLDLTLRDEARGKDLEVRIRAPKPAAGAPDALESGSPLIIFSHGAGGAMDAFPELSTHWASRGYVVVHPTHSDSISLRRKKGEDLSGLRENPQRLLMDVNGPDRLADCSFIIDSIDEIESQLCAAGVSRNPPPEENLPVPCALADWPIIDRDRIGMAGHSAGAYTTQIAFGAKVRGARWGSLRLKSHADPRIDAAILVSGQGTTNRSLTKDSWSGITGPMMVYAGSLDVSRISDETPESRREPFEYAPAGDKYLVYIDGATHGSYQGKGLATMLREKPTTDVAVITGAVSSGTTAFFDCYLRELEAAREYLESDALVELTAGAVEYKRK